MSESKFREPSSGERQLLARLLEPLPNRDELSRQLAGIRVRTLADDGSFEIDVPDDARRQDQYPISDGIATDVDGVEIDITLFAAGKTLRQVDIIRLDGTPIRKMPPASEFKVWTYDELRKMRS